MTTGTHDPPAADPSNERIFGVNLKRSALSLSLFPKRVLLNRLDGIFQAWKQGHETLPAHLKVSVANPPTGGFIGQSRVVLYDCDSYKYRSSVFFTHYHECPRIEITLSNDGFIYPPRGELSLNASYRSDAVHHQRASWVRLSDDTVRVHLPSILKGVKTILNMQHEDRIYGKVLYQEIDERVDFLFVNAEENPTFGVLVAFEPGHPEHYHRNDAWGVF
jgi:hypothetical protein